MGSMTASEIVASSVQAGQQAKGRNKCHCLGIVNDKKYIVKTFKAYYFTCASIARVYLQLLHKTCPSSRGMLSKSEF